VALVGLGRVAERIHIPAIAATRGLRLVGGSETDSAQARRVQERFGVPVICEDTGELLRSTAPDLVIVGTPPDVHHAHVAAALDAGAHVLCEKPFVTTLEEADDLVARAERAGRLLAVNNQYRFMSIYRETMRRISSGELGPLYQAQVWQQMFHPPSRETNWRAGLVRSTLYEFGTHALDLLTFLFDALPVAVTARIPRVPHGVPSDVLVVMLLEFPGDRVATLNLHRVSRAPERYLEMRLDTQEASLRLSLGGVARLSLDYAKALGRPALRASLAKGGEVRLEREGRSRVLVRSPRPEFATATADHLAHLVERLGRGDVSSSAARHARQVLRVVFAGYRSAETGRTERLDEPEE